MRITQKEEGQEITQDQIDDMECELEKDISDLVMKIETVEDKLHNKNREGIVFEKTRNAPDWPKNQSYDFKKLSPPKQKDYLIKIIKGFNEFYQNKT